MSEQDAEEITADFLVPGSTSGRVLGLSQRHLLNAVLFYIQTGAENVQMITHQTKPYPSIPNKSEALTFVEPELSQLV